jgi:hypothetical protein
VTALDDRPSTATGPTARTVTRSARGPVLLGLAVVLVVVLVALLTGARGGGRLDPRSYGPDGTHALAALLGRAGTPVQVVGDVAEAMSVPGATVVVPFPAALTSDELASLSAVPLVVLGADQDSVDALGIDAGTTDAGGTGSLRPDCSLEVAQRAGSVRLGGVGYASGSATAGCYPRGGTPTLLQVGSTTLLGSGSLLTNAHLDQDGNAALAVGLLHPATKVLWLIPRGDRAVTGERRSLHQLLPEWFDDALLQGAVALVLLALWRARRLGRVVVEPLPVVVRAAEAVEGRGRLYRSANARDRAAEALRSASRDAAARRLGLGPTGSPDSLAQAAAERTGRPAADVQALLYGPVPVDDASLVRLADALSRFDQEVAGS